MAYLRIGIGALLLLQAYLLAPNIYDLYGSSGLMKPALSQYFSNSPAASFLPPAGAGVFRFFSYDALVTVFFTLYLCSATLLTLGWYARGFAIATWFMHMGFLSLNPLSNYGVDRFLHFSLFYLSFLPASAHYALKKSRSLSKNRFLLGSIGTRVIQIHLCLVYLDAASSKALGSQWWNGEAIWRSLMLPEFRGFDFSWLQSVPWIPMLLGWTVMLIQASYAFLVWSMRTRAVALTLITTLHLGIAFFQGLHLFGISLAVISLCLFDAPAAYRTFWERNWRRRSQSYFRQISAETGPSATNPR